MKRVIKSVVTVVLLVLCGGWHFIKVPAKSNHSWPSTIPQFHSGAIEFSYEAPNTSSSFVCFTTHADAIAVLDDARGVFEDNGWALCPIMTHDMRIFTKRGLVAAALAESLPEYTRVTVVQRPKSN